MLDALAMVWDNSRIMPISPKVAATLGITSCQDQFLAIENSPTTAVLSAGVILMGMRQVESSARKFDEGIADRLAALIQIVESDRREVTKPGFRQTIDQLAHDIEMSFVK